MKKLLKKFDKTDIRYKFYHSLKTSSRILDLGCGLGSNAAIVKEKYPFLEIHGVDILEKINIPQFIIYQQVDLEKGTLPYPDDYFDAIIFIHVLEHLAKPLHLGMEINRILKKGGSVYVETPNWTSMLIPSFGFKREQHGPFNFFDDSTHIKPWSKQGLFELLYQSGLRVRKIGTVRNWYRILFGIPLILYGLIRGKRAVVINSFWNMTGWCIYGIATKNEIFE